MVDFLICLNSPHSQSQPYLSEWKFNYCEIESIINVDFDSIGFECRNDEFILSKLPEMSPLKEVNSRSGLLVHDSVVR